MDIVEFLTARYAEDQTMIDRNSGPRGDSGLGSGFPDYRTYDDEDIRAADAYIERFGPVRLRAELEARRRRLTLYVEARETLEAVLKGTSPRALEDDPATAHSYSRERIKVQQASGRFIAFEISVKLDAMAYAEHPDFKPEWRIDG